MRYLKEEIYLKKNNLFLYNCVIWIIKGIKQRFCRRAKHAKFFSRPNDGSSLLGSQMHEPRIFIRTNESANYKKNGIDTGCNRQVNIIYGSSHDDRYYYFLHLTSTYIMIFLLSLQCILSLLPLNVSKRGCSTEWSARYHLVFKTDDRPFSGT